MARDLKKEKFIELTIDLSSVTNSNFGKVVELLIFIGLK